MSTPTPHTLYQPLPETPHSTNAPPAADAAPAATHPEREEGPSPNFLRALTDYANAAHHHLQPQTLTTQLNLCQRRAHRLNKLLVRHLTGDSPDYIDVALDWFWEEYLPKALEDPDDPIFRPMFPTDPEYP